MIAIVKYNAGNIGSVTNALNRLGVENNVTDDPAELRAADKVIFPGVGEASTAMSYLRERALDEVIINLKQPVMGICLGMQLMCTHSEEGNTDCLGIFNTNVKRFPRTPLNPLKGTQDTEVNMDFPISNNHLSTLQNIEFKVPHMGWNVVGTIRSRRHQSFKEYEYDFRNKTLSPLGDLGVPQHHTTSPKSFEKLKPLARELRKNQTEAEKILWSQLKSRKREIPFLRQKPVGPFIPDFVSHQYKLIIELDGPIHRFQKQKDLERQKYLENEGYRVLRFDNSEVESDLNRVLDWIDMAVRKRVGEFEKNTAKPLNPLKGNEEFVKGGSSTITRDTILEKNKVDSLPLNPLKGNEGDNAEKKIIRKPKLLRNINNTDDVYYVHSYYANPNKNAVAVCDYIVPFASMMQKDNFYATQFHPEKSATVGEQILKNFIAIK